MVTRGAVFDLGANAGPEPWNGDPAQDIAQTDGALGYGGGMRWTFMVYVDGDNNLEGAGINELPANGRHRLDRPREHRDRVRPGRK